MNMGWEDIEEMPTAGLREEMLTLFEKEVEYHPRSGTSAASAALSISDDDIDDDDSDASRRHNVCQWNYECVDYFLFDREIVYYSMHYYDTYNHHQSIAAAKESMPSTQLNHLLALACLFVACKVHGAPTDTSASFPHRTVRDENGYIPRSKITLAEFCHMSRGQYCPQMIEEMELSVLTTLEWKLNPPSPTDFLIRFVKILSLLMKDDQQLYLNTINSTPTSSSSPHVDHVGKGWSVFEVARYQLELAAYSPELNKKYLPSTVALAAILNAMDSKIVRTKKTIISSRIRHTFIHHLKFLGGGMSADGEDIIEARTTLTKLCSNTIVLPGQIADDPAVPTSNDMTFTPIAAQEKSMELEYELPEVHSISPVSVATDRL